MLTKSELDELRPWVTAMLQGGRGEVVEVALQCIGGSLSRQASSGVCVCMCPCVCACVCVCMDAYVRACMHACVMCGEVPEYFILWPVLQRS